MGELCWETVVKQECLTVWISWLINAADSAKLSHWIAKVAMNKVILPQCHSSHLVPHSLPSRSLYNRSLTNFRRCLLRWLIWKEPSPDNTRDLIAIWILRLIFTLILGLVIRPFQVRIKIYGFNISKSMDRKWDLFEIDLNINCKHVQIYRRILLIFYCYYHHFTFILLSV